jgi:hypothetical protein
MPSEAFLPQFGYKYSSRVGWRSRFGWKASESMKLPAPYKSLTAVRFYNKQLEAFEPGLP